jgi:hypothetical protein
MADLHSCIVQSRAAFGTVMEGLPFTVCDRFSLFILLSLLFAPFFPSIKNFELHSPTRIHIKQE